MEITRRDVLLGGAAGIAGLASSGSAQQEGGPAPFHLKYAPHLGMFRHHAGDDPLDQIRFMHDEGFRAFEDNGMRGRDVALQEKIGGELVRRGMTMGVFVATADFGRVTFASADPAMRDFLVQELRQSVEVAKRVGARWCTVVPGKWDDRQAAGFQTANVVDNLRRCAEVCADSGLVMVLEPLNFRDHPGLFLTRIPQAYQICRTVNHPSCKILDDLYHQQVQEGNLIPNLDQAWSEIAYFQVGDNPGRREPTTGEINYRNVFRHLHQRGFAGVIGMEHGISRPGKEGERALIDAYRTCDTF